MTPEHALYRALTGKSPQGEHRPLPDLLRELETAYKGRKGAAAAVGVSTGTWGRWVRGVQKPGTAVRSGRTPAVDRLRLAQRRARLPRGRQARLAGRPDVVIRADVTVSSDTRPDRTIEPSRWGGFNRYDTMSKVIAVWLTGDDRAAVDMLIEGLQQEVPTMTLGDTDYIQVIAAESDGDDGDDDL